MKKRYIFAVLLVIVGFALIEASQYVKTLKGLDLASAFTVGIPNPGHALSSIECSADSLCIDTTNNRVGIGTNNPTVKLDVNGVINLNSNRITNVAAPTASADATNKAYVDAASVGPACPTNYANLCSNGGGLAFSYNGHTMYIDAFPRWAGAYFATSGAAEAGLSAAYEKCEKIGARIPTLAEWQAACAALSGPNGNGMTTFGGAALSDRWEWVANPDPSTASNAIVAGGSCSGTSTLNVNINSYYTNSIWFRCVR